MKIRQATEYKTTCPGCGSLLSLDFEDLHFEGLMDQRIPCPACRTNILVIQGGSITEAVVPITRDKAWRTVTV